MTGSAPVVGGVVGVGDEDARGRDPVAADLVRSGANHWIGERMSNLEQVRGVLTSVLCLGERGASLLPETRLLGNLPELDSMAVVAVITTLEERFGITVTDDEIDGSSFATVGALTDFVASKVAA